MALRQVKTTMREQGDANLWKIAGLSYWSYKEFFCLCFEKVFVVLLKQKLRTSWNKRGVEQAYHVANEEHHQRCTRAASV